MMLHEFIIKLVDLAHERAQQTTEEANITVNAVYQNFLLFATLSVFNNSVSISQTMYKKVNKLVD